MVSAIGALTFHSIGIPLMLVRSGILLVCSSFKRFWRWFAFTLLTHLSQRVEAHAVSKIQLVRNTATHLDVNQSTALIISIFAFLLYQSLKAVPNCVKYFSDPPRTKCRLSVWCCHCRVWIIHNVESIVFSWPLQVIWQNRYEARAICILVCIILCLSGTIRCICRMFIITWQHNTLWRYDYFL